MTQRETLIFNFVRANGPCSVRQIKDALRIQRFQTVNAACNTLAEAGLLLKDDTQHPHHYTINQSQNPPHVETAPHPMKPSPERTDSQPWQRERADYMTLDDIKNKKVLYIIPCCARKSAGGQPANERMPAANVLNILPPHLREAMQKARLHALNYAQGALNLQGIEFGLPSDNAQYMEARDRYDGHLYRVGGGAIHALLANPLQSQHIMIMSALYGLLTCDDLIQNYNLEMGSPRAVGHLWAKTLPSIIDACAGHLKVDIIIGLFARANGQISYSYVFSQLANQAGVPAYMIHPQGCGTAHICQGPGHMLLHLVGGIPIPHGFDYDIVRVRP